MKPHQTRPKSIAHCTWVVAGTLLFGLTAVGDALAYKVERVCEMTESTSKKPATKVCKTLLVKPAPAEAKDDKKDAKKEEKPAAAHH